MILKVAADPTELPDRVRAELTGADHAVAPDRFAGAAQPVRDVEVLLELVPQWDMDERPAVQRRLNQPVPCQNPAQGLTCWFTLGARAYSPRLPVHGPDVRLAGAPSAQRRRQGRGDPRATARGRGAAAAGRAPEAGLG